MKAILFALFVGLLMVGCGEQVVNESKLQDRNGVMYIPNEENPFTGRAESFYDNGQKEWEANYKDGKVDGLWTDWYENGQKKAEANWKDGKEAGFTTAWYENGQKQGEGHSKDGERHGVWIFYTEYGTELVRETYKDGIKVD